MSKAADRESNATAATLPTVACDLMPIDLYNLLFALRSRKAGRQEAAA